VSIDDEARLLSREVVHILKEERERRGLSKYALSGRCGLSQQAIGYTERQITEPSLETIVRIALALDMSLPEVFMKARRRSDISKTDRGTSS